jgi:electron transfer flavoprotein beta subunit
VGQDSYFVAAQIAEVARAGNYDLVLTGKETIDYNSSSVGGMLAAMLDVPFISLATKFENEGSGVRVTREIEGGDEVVEASLPLVVSCQKGMAEQRIPNMKGIMGARTKPLKVIEPKALQPLTKVLGFEMPPPKAGVKLIPAENAAELVRLLREEAKVI